jgi:hypothetical protein
VIKCIEACRERQEDERYAPIAVDDYVRQKWLRGLPDSNYVAVDNLPSLDHIMRSDIHFVYCFRFAFALLW